MIGLALAGIAGVTLTAIAGLVCLSRQQVNHLIQVNRMLSAWSSERASLLDRVQHPQVFQSPERYLPPTEGREERAQAVQTPSEPQGAPHEDLEELALVGGIVYEDDPPVSRKHVPEEEARALQAQLAHAQRNGADEGADED